MNDRDLQDRLLAEFQDIDDIGDNSIDESSSEIPVLIEYISGFRKNSNIVWSIDEENLYYGGNWNETLQARTCTCYDEKCLGKIYVRRDSTAFSLPESGHTENHGTMYKTYKNIYV